jgi:hypothetical protein
VGDAIEAERAVVAGTAMRSRLSASNRETTVRIAAGDAIRRRGN